MIDTLVQLLPKAENGEWKGDGDGGKWKGENGEGILESGKAERIVKVLELWQDRMARGLPEEV